MNLVNENSTYPDQTNNDFTLYDNDATLDFINELEETIQIMDEEAGELFKSNAESNEDEDIPEENKEEIKEEEFAVPKAPATEEIDELKTIVSSESKNSIRKLLNIYELFLYRNYRNSF
jgi:Ser-tRNA(Ala) deacylase AlaX